MFLLLNGCFTGIFYFFKMRNPNQLIVFQTIHQAIFYQLREEIRQVIHNSTLKSFVMVLYFAGIYCLLSKWILSVFGSLLNVELQNESYFEHLWEIFDLRLLVYSWVLSSQILSNMQLMTQITTILSTEPHEFDIEFKGDLTLTDALSVEKYQVTQSLAALDFFLLSDSVNSHRRKQFYALSVPGGHPNNWKQLVNQCLLLIDKFSENLEASLKGVTIKNNNTNRINFNKPITSSEMSEKLFTRQYNERFGIRSMGADSSLDSSKQVASCPEESTILQKINSFKKYLFDYSAISFFFGEPKNAKLCFLLIQQSQIIIWVTQGLASLVDHSIDEDSYGVVQNDIKRILKSYLKLKTVLDKIVAINVGVKKIDWNYLAIRNAVKRSIYKFVLKFSRYFDDLMIEPEDVRALQNFVNFKEL